MRIQKNATAIAVAAIALLATAGCATNSQPNDDAPGDDVAAQDYVGTSWKAESSDKAHLEFAEDGTYTGSDGCNNLQGEYTATGDEITLSPGASTLIGCDDPGSWLFGASTVTVEGATLTVFDADGEQIGTLTS